MAARWTRRRRASTPTRAMRDGAPSTNAPRMHTRHWPRSAPRHAPCATHQERIELHEWLCEHEGAGLVYCGRRQTCDELAGALAEAGVDAVAYHAGKDAATRSRLQRGFCGGDTRVMVATVPRTMESARCAAQHTACGARHHVVRCTV